MRSLTRLEDSRLFLVTLSRAVNYSSLLVLGALVRGGREVVSWPFPCRKKFDIKTAHVSLVWKLATLHCTFLIQSPPGWLCVGALGSPCCIDLQPGTSIILLYASVLQIKISDANYVLEKSLKMHRTFCPVQVLFLCVTAHYNYAVFSGIHQVKVA